MTDRRRREAQDRDPHQPINVWLLGGARDELPRDLAVHASLCAECRRRIAAFDMLTAVHLDRAGFPPARTATARSTRRSAAVAAGGVVALSAVAAVAAGGWRLIPGQGPASNGAQAPTQEVLGNTGGPQVSPHVRRGSSRSPTPTATDRASASPTPTAPLPVTVPTSAPATPRPRHSLTPRAVPSATPRPSIVLPIPTPAPTVTPEPPTPTQQPSVEATPSATAPGA